MTLTVQKTVLGVEVTKEIQSEDLSLYDSLGWKVIHPVKEAKKQKKGRKSRLSGE